MLMGTEGTQDTCLVHCLNRYTCTCRYESLVAGSPSFAAQYKNKLYCFTSETNLDRFMRLALCKNYM